MKFLNFIILFVASPLFIIAQWDRVESMPNGFSSHHSFGFADDNYGYIVTGVNTSNDPTKVFFRYDPIADSWEQLDDFDGPARGFAIGDTYNGKAYLGFGQNDSGRLNDLWEYDMATGQWRELAECPCDARIHPAMVATEGKIFVGLGGAVSGNLKDFWEYDIATNSWSQKPNFPGQPRHHPYQFAVDGKVYVGLGHGNGFISDEMYEYDPQSEKWRAVAFIPAEGRVAGTQFSFEGKGYVLSGDGEDHRTMEEGEFYSYDPVLDKWEKLPPHPGTSRWAPASFVLNNEVYLINGQTLFGSNYEYVFTNWKYTLKETSSVLDDDIIISLSPNPTSNVVRLDYNSKEIDDVEVKLYNIQGQLVLSTKSQKEINVESLPEGLYNISIIIDNEIVLTERIVKQ